MGNTPLQITDGQAVAIRTKEDELSNLQRLGNILAASGYFSDAREMAQAAVKVMAGQELGLPPIASMMGINIIKGKVALGAHLIASRVKAHGYDIRFKSHTNEGCVLEFLSKLEGGKRSPIGESSFTEADAKAAGIFSDMYRKYPKNMYFSRAVSNGAKWFTPEVFGGAPVYTPEELGAEVDGNGEIVQNPLPDTGGHPVNTKAAAQHVAEQKIANMQAQREAEQATKTPVDAACDEFKLADRFGRLASFGALKKASIEFTGSDFTYREILGKHIPREDWRDDGQPHADGFKKFPAAAAAFRELWEHVAKVSAPPTAADDRSDWLPEELNAEATNAQ